MENAKPQTALATALHRVIAGPLRRPGYAVFWSASLLSSIASMVQSVGTAWYVVSVNPSPVLVASLQTAATIPIILLSFVAGAIADTIGRKLVMLAGQITIAVASLALAWAASSGLQEPGLILAMSALTGVALAFYGPSAQAMLSSLVGRELLPAAISLGSLSYNLSRTLGPALGGIVVAAFGPAPAMMAGALGAIILSAVVLGFKTDSGAKSDREPIFEGIAVGAQFIALSPELLGVLARSAAFTLCAGVVLAFPSLIAAAMPGGGPDTLGMLLAAFGIGAITAAFAGPRLRGRFSPAAWSMGCSTAMGACLAVIGSNFGLIITLVGFALAGAFWVGFLTPLTLAIQMHAPGWMSARAAAAFQVTLAAGLAIGGPVWGAVAEVLGVGPALIIAGATLAGLALQMRKLPFPDIQQTASPDLASPSPTSFPPTAPRDGGRIVVTIEYRVSLAASDAFRSVMAKLGRARLRNGAQRWSLNRDLEDAELWVERFESPSWAAHLRRLRRPTATDEELRAAAIALSLEPVRIRRFVQAPRPTSPLDEGPGRNDPSP